jgi:hypothetical protein
MRQYKRLIVIPWDKLRKTGKISKIKDLLASVQTLEIPELNNHSFYL